MDAAAKAPPIGLPPANASTLAPLPAQTPIDPKIQKVADDFEAMVIGEMLKPMFQALDVNGLGGGGSGEAMFRPLLVDEYAKSMAKAGGIGVAAEVAREMMRLQGASAAPKETDNGSDR